jgi:hypothetical protein
LPKALAQDKKALKRRLVTTGLKCLGRTLAAILLLSLTLLLFTESAEAQRLSWWAKRMYTLKLKVSYTYENEWGDKIIKDGSRFTQSYRLTHRGYIVDPRLVNYETGIRFNDRSVLDGLGSSYSSTGFNVRVTLFESIQRGKGLKMWKYVPSPIVLKYSLDMFGNGQTAQQYSVSMYYTRPGTLRVFSNKKMIFYDDGTNNNMNLRRTMNGKK